MYPSIYPSIHLSIYPSTQALGEGAPALPSTLVFDHPTARQLAAFFEPQHDPAAPAPPPLVTAAGALLSAEVVLAGTSALLPQGADGVASVWRVSAGGHDLVGEVPAARCVRAWRRVV